MPIDKNLKGFTLLEILLVVAAIAILAGIVIFAVNPSKQLGQTRDAQRKMDVNQLLSAIYQYNIANGGVFPKVIQTASDCSAPSLEICKTGATDCSGLTELSPYLVGVKADFLIGIPTDPSGSTSNGSGYSVYRNSITNRITVCAPHSESENTFSLTR